MTTLAFADLSQRKLVTGTPPTLSYWTQEFLSSSSGLLVNPFKILVAGSQETMTVATYNDVKVGTVYLPNPMKGFSRGSSFTGVALAGDALEILTPPEYWGLPANTTYSVPVSSVDGAGNLVLERPFWTRESSLDWRLIRAGVTVASGLADGVTQRLNTANNYYLDDRFQSVYFSSADALTHLAYTQKMLASLAAAINAASSEYTQAPNPITSSYSA